MVLPEKLLDTSKKYPEGFGYRNVQEFVLELLRKTVFFERIRQYQKIDEEMLSGKNIKKFNQKDAVEYLKDL